MSQAAERARKLIASWSVLYDARREFLKQYRTVWDIPVRDSLKDVLLEELRAGARVLEIGSSDRKYEALLRESFPGLSFKSMDIDRETKHDYYSLDDIRESFDAVLLFEVLEHMQFAEAVDLLARAYDLLAPGGRLILTTPNVAHPTHYYRDPTHVTAYSHESVGGILTGLGYEVTSCWRIYNAPFVQKALHRYVAAPLHEFLNVDFAHTLMAVARRPGEDIG